MRIVAKYSFNGGEKYIKEKFLAELGEIETVVSKVDAVCCKTKQSRERARGEKILYSPYALNLQFKKHFGERAWRSVRQRCEYKYGEFLPGYVPDAALRGAYREMDFVHPQSKIGVEVQFGKYAFMVYNVCAKMTIFHKLGFINCGVEIVPVKNMAKEMSTGVSYFEQFAWDLEHRGISNIDIPVLILGVDV
ncbi:MAG: hypothetical protein J6K20_01500 [Thermoguttaceae bacterium]|nr:hypothetical protein [Thermoguttaceae bacterium]